MAAAVAELPDERLWPRLEDRLPSYPPDYSVLHPLLLRPPRCVAIPGPRALAAAVAVLAAAAVLVVNIDEDLSQHEEGLGLRRWLPLQLVVGDHQHRFPLDRRMRGRWRGTPVGHRTRLLLGLAPAAYEGSGSQAKLGHGG